MRGETRPSLISTDVSKNRLGIKKIQNLPNLQDMEAEPSKFKLLCPRSRPSHIIIIVLIQPLPTRNFWASSLPPPISIPHPHLIKPHI